MLTIKFLKAAHGDSIAITIGEASNSYRILVDGGPKECFVKQSGPKTKFGPLKELLDLCNSKNTKIDLTVLTHVDDDHIGGLLAAVQYPQYRPLLFNKLLFNSGKIILKEFGGEANERLNAKVKIYESGLTSISQGVDFDEIMTGINLDRRACVSGDRFCVPGGEITILSPERAQLQDLLTKWNDEAPSSLTSTKENDYNFSIAELAQNDVFKEDGSVTNASSIAFLLRTKTASVLLLGDALPSTICRTLTSFGYSTSKPLKVDLCKLSHHASKANTNSELLGIIDCNKYVVSTNGLRHNLPNKATFARILNLNPNSELLFIYPELIKKVFSQNEIEKYGERLQVVNGEIVL